MHTTFRTDQSGIVDENKSMKSSFGGSRISGHKSNITENNADQKKLYRFKDRPETIDHDILVGALK